MYAEKTAGIKCPKCDGPTLCSNGRPTKAGHFRRIRICKNCNYHFATVEKYISNPKPGSGSRDWVKEWYNRV